MIHVLVNCHLNFKYSHYAGDIFDIFRPEALVYVELCHEIEFLQLCPVREDQCSGQRA
jgi:hypothetical protein